MSMIFLKSGLVSACVAVFLLVSGCGTFQPGMTWAPERIAYHTDEDGEVDRVEQYDANDVCRRILFFGEDGGLALVQERDAEGVCRRATYYDEDGRIARIQERDTGGIAQETIRFDANGMPVQ